MKTNEMEKVDVLVRPNQDGWWAAVTSLPGCFSSENNVGKPGSSDYGSYTENRE